MPAVKHEPEYIEIDGHGKCEVLVVPKLSSMVEHRHYVKASFTHPAKMSTMLCREIIRRYTEKGDVVLDPMAGIGTTLSEAVLLGRNAVGVELEDKFVKLSEKNIRLLKKIRTPAPRGKAIVIKGDSRKLSGILREKTDNVIFSPPYRERYAYKNPEERQKDDPTASKRNRIHKPYSQDPDNIGNLKYGKPYVRQASSTASRMYGKPVDAVVTSPPFADAEHHYKHGLKTLGKNFRGRKAWEEKERVQSEPENIGRLKYGKPVDAVVTSPPFFSTVQERGYQGQGKHNIAVDPAKHGHKGIITLYAQSRENIDNIEKYGQVDAIVTSPPYADTPLQDYATSNKALLSFERKVRESFREKGYYEFNGKRYTEREWRRINKGELKPRGMPELWKRIISQRKGSGYSEIARVDAIVTSPPFAEAQSGGGIAKKGYDGPKHTKTDLVGRRSYMPENVGDSEGNISNMPYGKVDAIVTSPPFAQTPGGLTGKHNIGAQIREGRPTRASKRTFAQRKVSEDPRNIDNLATERYGKVDSVIFSPPYSESLTGKRDVEKEIAGWEKRQPNHPRLKTLKRRTEKGSCFVTRDYSQSNKNIGNLPHGKVDAVITSPPYSESMSKKRKGYTTHPDLSKTRHMGEGSSDENIGNLRHGQIDAIVTSPPYEKSISKRGREEPRERIADRLRKAGFSEEYIGRYFTDNPSDNKMKGMGIHDAYSTDPSNIGNLPHGQVDAMDNIGSKKGETYLQAMFHVYRECYKTLKPGGKMVLVIKDFVRAKKVVRLDLDTKRLCEVAGFRWVETKLFRLPSKSFWRTLYERKYPEVDTSLLRFEFIEVFERPLEVFP